MSDEELHNLVRQRLLEVLANNGSRQKTVAIKETERYLAEGWEYVAVDFKKTENVTMRLKNV